MQRDGAPIAVPGALERPGRAEHLAHPLRPPVPGVVVDPMTDRAALEAQVRVQRDEVRGRLRPLITEDMRVWCKPSTKFAHGKPYRAIIDTARAEATDLIVIGVRGRNPLDLTVFGSTTNQVVRQATCPVLTLKQP